MYTDIWHFLLKQFCNLWMSNFCRFEKENKKQPLPIAGVVWEDKKVFIYDADVGAGGVAVPDHQILPNRGMSL